MATIDAPVSDPDAAVLSTRSVLLAWVVPAVLCSVLIAVLLFASPFAGGIVSIAGVAYLATSLLLTVGVLLLRRAPAGPLVAVLTATWTSAWVLGVLTFGLIALLLGALDAGTPSEGFVISPVFWLLSFPMYLIFLLAALLSDGARFRRHGHSRR